MPDIGLSVATLHIDEREARLLVTRGGRVLRWAEAVIAPGVISGGKVADVAALAATLRLLAKRVKASRSRPVLSLAELHPVVRTFTLPKLKAGMLSEAVQRDMKRELNAPLNQFRIYWRVIAASGDQVRVHVAAVRAEDMQGYMDACKRASLTPREVKLEAVALARGVAEPGAIVVSLRRAGFSIVVIEDGVPAAVRDIAYPRHDTPIDERVAEVSKELQLTMGSVYMSSAPKVSDVPPAVYLVGPGSRDHSLASTLARDLGYAPASFDLPFRFPAEFPAEAYPDNLALAAPRKRSLLAIRSTAPEPVLLPTSGYAALRLPVAQSAALLALVMALGAAISPVRAALQLDPANTQLQADIKRANDTSSRLRGQVNAARKADADAAKGAAAAKQLDAAASKIVTMRQRWPEALASVVKASPNVDVLAVTENLANATINARAATARDAVAFATRLESLGIFKAVMIPSLTQNAAEDGATGVRFDVLMAKAVEPANTAEAKK